MYANLGWMCLVNLDFTSMTARIFWTKNFLNICSPVYKRIIIDMRKLMREFKNVSFEANENILILEC